MRVLAVVVMAIGLLTACNDADSPRQAAGQVTSTPTAIASPSPSPSLSPSLAPTPTPPPTPAPAPAAGTGSLVNCDVADADRPLDATEQALLAALNDYRRELELPAFAPSPTLSRIARWKAAQLAAAGGPLLHDDPGRTWDQRFDDCGYPAEAAAGENLGDTDGGIPDLLFAWKASPTHDANLRNPAFTFIGVARVATSGAQTIWVTAFGSDPR